MGTIIFCARPFEAICAETSLTKVAASMSVVVKGARHLATISITAEGIAVVGV